MTETPPQTAPEDGWKHTGVRVVPGDQLKLEVMQKRLIRRMGLYDCRALVGDQEVASAEILCAAPESNA